MNGGCTVGLIVAVLGGIVLSCVLPVGVVALSLYVAYRVFVDYIKPWLEKNGVKF